MFELFKPVKGLIEGGHVCIDNNVFRLHYKATAVILGAFSVLVTSKQYVGEPIHCMFGKETSKMMETYCWIQSTFTIPRPLAARMYDIAPGVGPIRDDQHVKHHNYYQWVCMVLFFQAMLFYAPHYLWKSWEGGRMKMLSMDLNCPVVNEECRNDRRKLITDYFMNSLHHHNSYVICFFTCEVLNFLNVVCQIFLIDVFLDGEFTKYGWNVITFSAMDPHERNDPMSTVFPKMTKCFFHSYGPSGSIQTLDGLCVLPLNVVNEKIYVFLWFWFMLLAMVSALSILYRIAVFMLKEMRVYLLYSQARMNPFKDVRTVAKACNIGDWFILYQLSKNIDSCIFKELMSDLARLVGGKEKEVV